MVRKGFYIYAIAVILLAAAPGGRAATILGGLEDNAGSSGLEKNGDFNDVIFELTGNVSMEAPGGLFSNLTPGVVNQNGTVFWDNPSGDGPDMNIGYMLADDPSLSGLQYLAMPGGGSVNDVTFDASGTVTLTLLGGITKNPENTLGWYDLDDPSVLHPLVAVPPDAAGDTVSFAPDGAFALYSTDGWGQTYSSVSASNVNESPNQEHFAFFEEPGSMVPEPSSGTLVGVGVALLGLGMIHRRRHTSPTQSRQARRCQRAERTLPYA